VEAAVVWARRTNVKAHAALPLREGVFDSEPDSATSGPESDAK